MVDIAPEMTLAKFGVCFGKKDEFVPDIIDLYRWCQCFAGEGDKVQKAKHLAQGRGHVVWRELAVAADFAGKQAVLLQ